MKSNYEWEYWGRTDPLWSVANWKNKQADGSAPWTPEEFIRLGELDFADVAQHWSHYGLLRGRCVEIGCGAGRITRQLVNTFEAVLAVDVSDHQIARAQQLLGPAAARVEFHVVREPVLPTQDASCDAMFSSHVFQHFPSSRGVRLYLRESFRVLRPGATICVHIPVPGAHLTASHSMVWLWLRNAYKKAKRSEASGNAEAMRNLMSGKLTAGQLADAKVQVTRWTAAH